MEHTDPYIAVGLPYPPSYEELEEMYRLAILLQRRLTKREILLCLQAKGRA